MKEKSSLFNGLIVSLLKCSERYFNIGYDHNGMTFDLNCLSPCIFEKVNESISSCNPLPPATWTIITRRTNMKKKTRTNIKKQQDKNQDHQDDEYEEKNRTNIKKTGQIPKLPGGQI